MDNKQEYHEIFKNPSLRELQDVVKENDYGGDSVKGIFDLQGNFYVSSYSDIEHYDIANLSKVTQYIPVYLALTKSGYIDTIAIGSTYKYEAISKEDAISLIKSSNNVSKYFSSNINIR